MTRIRRSAALLAAAAAVLLFSALPATAGFADSAAAPALTVGTVDVAAPGSFSATGSSCTRIMGTNGVRLRPVLSWTASTSPGVSGYQVHAFLSDGRRIPVGTAAAGATSYRGDLPTYVPTSSVRFSVSTLTSYGWTEESARSAVFPC